MQVGWLGGCWEVRIYQKGKNSGFLSLLFPKYVFLTLTFPGQMEGSFDVIKVSVPLENGHYPLFSYPEVASGGSIVDVKLLRNAPPLKVCESAGEGRAAVLRTQAVLREPILRHHILIATRGSSRPHELREGGR